MRLIRHMVRRSLRVLLDKVNLVTLTLLEQSAMHSFQPPLWWSLFCMYAVVIDFLNFDRHGKRLAEG